MQKYLQKACLFLCLSLIFQQTGAQNGIGRQVDTGRTNRMTLLPTQPDSVRILYDRFVKKNLNTGAIGYVNGKVLESTVNSYIFHGVTGRLAGLITTQNSGIPGSDDVSLNLRGRSPLIILDGVPRNITELNPEQIASVTVVKDAISSVMLGQRSMNGAIILTTRKGEEGKDYFNFKIKTQGGIQAPVKTRKYLNAFDYSTLYNEALANDGRPAVYSAADLQAYKDGSDPYLHPNVDWQDVIYKKNAAYSRVSAFADGKRNALRYMVSLDYLNQGGLLKQLDANAYSTNADYKRYILRSNINLKLTKTLEGYLNLYGRVNNTNAPAGGNLTAVTSELNTTPNNAYPVFNPDGSLGGNLNYVSNLFGRSTYNGYFQNLTREGFFDFGVKQSLDHLVEGLSVGGKVSFSSISNLTTNRSKAFGVVNFNKAANGDSVYTILSTPGTQGNASDVTTSEQTSYIEATADYQHRFGNNGLKVFLTANSENYKIFINTNLPRTITNYAASIKYDLSEKYIIEGAAAYSGLNYYRKGQQYAFFPAVGLGWNIDKENFMSDVAFVNQLKLRANYGLTGGTNQGNFNYQKRYFSGSNYVFGPNATFAGGLVEGPITYENTWSEALKTNIGLDASFLDSRLWTSLDYFVSNQSKLPIITGFNSGILGNNYPVLYEGKSDIKGWEVSAGWAGTPQGKFSYSVSGNVAAYQTKIKYNAEQFGSFANLIRTGTYTNQRFGYIADGFVETAGQGPVITGYASLPGDIKYKDMNGDNTIDYRDVAPLGNAKPVVSYGLSTQMLYGRFHFSLLLQGVANTNVVLSGNTVFPFLNTANGGLTQAFPESLNRWTPQTASTATFPRLTLGGNDNNYAASSFWLRSTSFLRLKNAEVGYDIGSSFLNRINIKNVRVFLNGQNLFTVSKFKIFDPEMPFADYGILRVVNAGLSVTF